jgi:apolipoprotein N-acyltransferase
VSGWSGRGNLPPQRIECGPKVSARLLNFTDKLSGLNAWRACAVAIICGAALALALPPVYFFPAIFFSFPILIWQLSAAPSLRRAFVIGWGFGFGFFVAGLYWIGNAVLVDAERFGWLWPFAVSGLPAFLALFIAAAAVVTHILVPPVKGTVITRVIVFTAMWAVAEWLRGNILTGFPWNLVGYAWSLSDLSAQSYALGGVTLMSVITVLAGAFPAVLIGGRKLALAWILPIILVLPFLAYGAWRLQPADTVGVHENIRLRIVQPNIPQHLKWRQDQKRLNFEKLIAISDTDKTAYNYLIWPESAAPYFLENEVKRRRDIAAILPTGSHLITGAIRYRAAAGRISKLWNSVLVINHQGQVTGSYDKQHLVPFGEYLPKRDILSRIGIDKLAAGAIDYVAGRASGLMEVDGLPPFRALICYEVVFPNEVARNPRPTWLLNVTNDAWYGDSSGPRQHFEIARARAIENGVPMVRVANTGISGIVDSYGRVVSKLAMNTSGVIDGNLPKSLSQPTIYARYQEWPFAVMVGFLFALGLLLRLKSNRI